MYYNDLPHQIRDVCEQQSGEMGVTLVVGVTPVPLIGELFYCFLHMQAVDKVVTPSATDKPKVSTAWIIFAGRIRACPSKRVTFVHPPMSSSSWEPKKRSFLSNHKTVIIFSRFSVIYAKHSCNNGWSVTKHDYFITLFLYIVLKTGTNLWPDNRRRWLMKSPDGTA